MTLRWRVLILSVGDHFNFHPFLMSYRHLPLQPVWTEPMGALFLILSLFFSLWASSFFLSLVGSYLHSIHVLQLKIIWFLRKTLHKTLFPLYPSKQSLVPIQKHFPQLSSILLFQGSVRTRRPPCLSSSMGLVFIHVLLFSYFTHISASEMALGNFNHCQAEMSVLSTKYSAPTDSRQP